MDGVADTPRGALGFRVDGPRIKFGKFQKLSMVFSALLRTL